MMFKKGDNIIMHKVRKNMGFPYIIIAFCFLFNPDISVVDLLPDFIGYIFLLLGLRCLSDINGYLSDSYGYFKKALWVSVAKFASVFVLFGLVQPNESAVSFLLFPFVFSVLELIFIIPGYKSLFDGMNYLGTRLDGKAVFERKPNRKKNVTERLAGYTFFFVFFKAGMSVLPELASLATFEYVDKYAFVDWYGYIGLYRAAAFSAVLCVGIVWLVKAVKYFTAVIYDRNFVAAIREKYVSEVLPHEALFIRRRIHMALTVIAFGAFFSIDFYSNNINIIPDFLAAAAWIWAYIILRRDCTYVRRGIISAACFGVLSVIKSLTEFYFFGNYTLTLVYKSADAYYSYMGMIAVSVLENLSFAVSAVFLFIALRNIIANHTGYIYSFSASSAERSAERNSNSRLHRELNFALVPIIVFAVISACCGVAYVALLLGHEVINEIMWLIDFVAGLAFALFVLKNIIEINENVKSRYILI